MKFLSILSFAGMIIPLGTYAQAQDGSFYLGNANLHEGNIEPAIAHYQEARQGEFSAATSAQLARCYEAKGQMGPAFLHLEQAQLMDPKNKALRKTHEDWLGKYSLSHPKVSFFENIISYASATFWSGLWGIAIWLFLVLVAYPKPSTLAQKAIRNALWAMDIFLWLAAIPTIHFFEKKYRQAIAVHDVPVRVAPTEKSPTLCSLRNGEFVYPQKQHTGFLYITTLDRHSGWVASQDAEWIIPRSS
jgi:tetratricopeptide (TPR) repeat protein